MRDANSQIEERPVSPAIVLSQWIRAGNLTQKQAARELYWREPELSMILTNRRFVSERMAGDLARVFKDTSPYQGWSATDWLNLQKKFINWTKTAQGASEARRSKGEPVGILCDTDIYEAVEAEVLKIEPFNEMCVQPASYDLTAGILTWFGRFERDGERRQVEISDEKWATLAPGESVRVDAREVLEIPTNMTARVACVGDLVHKGVLCAFGIQLEPGWKGRPFFTLFHQGDEDIEIGPEDACVSVEFQFLQRTPKNPFGKALRPERFAGRGARN